MLQKLVEAHPFLPNLEPETIEKMLKQVGANSIAELFADIPEGLQLKRKLAIPDMISGTQIKMGGEVPFARAGHRNSGMSSADAKLMTKNGMI